MNVNIRGKKIEVTDAIKNYIEEKIGRLERYFKNGSDKTANVLIKLRGINQVVEVTINTKDFVLRAEESEKDLYAAIDKVSDKIERQIRKNKTRMHKKVNKEKLQDFEMAYIEEEKIENNDIVKRKVIETKPMSEEEAILQMELIGHDFYAFKNAKNNEINVIYRRKDNDYGLMEIK